jgi:hypothetical protein
MEQTNTFQSLGIAMQNGLRRTVILKPKQQASNNNDTNHNPAKNIKLFEQSITKNNNRIGEI